MLSKDFEIYPLKTLRIKMKATVNRKKNKTCLFRYSISLFQSHELNTRVI